MFARLEDWLLLIRKKVRSREQLSYSCPFPAFRGCSRTWPSRPIHNNPQQHPKTALTGAQLLPWETYRYLIKTVRQYSLLNEFYRPIVGVQGHLLLVRRIFENNLIIVGYFNKNAKLCQAERQFFIANQLSNLHRIYFYIRVYP